MRPWSSCASVAESKRIGTAGGKVGKWYVGLHSERIRVQEQGCPDAIIQGLGEATLGILCAVLASLSEEGCPCYRGSTAKVYQADYWDDRSVI